MAPTPSLRIDTARADGVNNSGLQSASVLKHFSSIRISASPTDEYTSNDLDRSSSKIDKKSRNGTRKLLLHVLAQLQVRPRPPTIYESATSLVESARGPNTGIVIDSVKDLFGRAGSSVVRTQSQSTAVEDDLDDEPRLVYSTDDTYELMLQIRDIFVVCKDRNWPLFDDDIAQAKLDADKSKAASAFRKSVSSFQGSSPHSPSPIRQSTINASELWLQCVSILASVVQEECRYKATAPGPRRPAHALHAVCLDVAQYLARSQWHDPQLLSHVAQATIPAFSTFPKDMHGRVLKFFEESIILCLLEDLRLRQRGEPRRLPEESTPSDIVGENDAAITIQIQGVEQDVEDDQEDALPSGLTVASTYSAMQSKPIYLTASIISPLLSAILENVSLQRHEQLRRLLVSMSRLKFDVSLDLLQVIAYHTPRARLSACTVLMALWRKAVGHIVVTEPLPDVQIMHDNLSSLNHPHLHQFVPWRFSQSPTPDPSTSRSRCNACANLIAGFGLICHLCMCGVHFDCYDYPQGCRIVEYSMATDYEVKKAAMHRFCCILTDDQATLPRAPFNGHHFSYLNLFTLTPCSRCRQPLWGCYLQAIGCPNCSTFYHPACFTAALSGLPSCKTHAFDFSHLTVGREDLRNTFTDHYQDILQTTSSPEHQSFEETSILSGLLWTQLQILTNGIALGTIAIVQEGRIIGQISQLDGFELHNMNQHYIILLQSNDLRISQAMDDYLFENRLDRHEHNLMFDWSCLAFISTAIRGPCFQAQLLQRSTAGFLDASYPEPPAEETSSQDQTFNVVSLSHIRRALGYMFNVTSESTLRLFPQYLSLLGFLQMLQSSKEFPNQQLCSSILPFSFDSSVEVEILVAAIEACLSDENLSVNEIGFLLLTRRLAPNGMSSEYALRRLARSVIFWILMEDGAVATILRDFVAQGRHMPGVPSIRTSPTWPEGASYRPPVSSSINASNYIAFRRTIGSRYAMGWLLALHDQDALLYAEVLYDACVDFVNVETVNSQASLILPPGRHESNINENILRCITKLSQASVIYSTFDRLTSRWMESVSMSKLKVPMPTLHKVFSLERNNSMRFSISSDSAMTDQDNSETIAIDPWRPILVLAGRRGQDLARSLDWLNILASGGVQIPTPQFLHFVGLISEEKNLSNVTALVNAAFKNVWLDPLARHDILLVFSKLHVSLSSIIVPAGGNVQNINQVVQFIRLSLASYLLIFGCERKKLCDMTMILDDDIQGLLLRRKTNHRKTWRGDPITIDSEIMRALELYVDIQNDEISILIAKFFNSFLTDSPFMEAHEVDNFVLRNGKVLAKSAWQFYSTHQPELHEIRASLLSRTIVVDSQPFYDICHENLLPSVSWEGRLSAVTRLFRVIQDITHPAFEVEGRHWRSSITVVLYFYFRTLWTDGKEEVRLAVKTAALTLRPAYMQAMQACWIELLNTAPITERVRLLSFLYQVLSYFPHWQALSWRAITDALSECEYVQDSKSEDDQDMIALRVSLLLLSLQMTANGAAVSTTTLLVIKKHLVDFIGFSNVIATRRPDGQISRVEFGDIEAVSDDATPCINELVAILDSSYPFELTPSTMTITYEEDDKPSRHLVGSLFIDVILVMFCTLKDLSSFPVLTLKRVLESLCIIVYKHDFESPPLIHLQHRLRQAVARSLDLLLEDISYELHQIALSFVHGFIKQCSGFMSSIIYKAIEQLGQFVATENRHPSDVLVIQARSFLEEILTLYASNGLFANLLKRPLSREFFMVLKETINSGLNEAQMAPEELKNLLLRDVITRAADFDHDAFQNALRNLSTYIEIVHHEAFNFDCIILVGQQLINLARRASNDDRLDPSPLFTIPAVLCENNQGRIRDLVPYIENEIRIVLTRTYVNFTSLYRLLCATQSLQRRNGSLVFANSVTPIIFEILADGLKLKARVQPSTLAALIQVVVFDDSSEWLPPAVTYPSMFLGLVDNALHFLLAYEWPESNLEDAFNSSVAAAKIIWRAIVDDARVTEKLTELGSEGHVSTQYRIRAWNVMAIAALQYPDKNQAASILFSYLGMFSDIQFLALRPYIHTDPAHWDPATPSINHAYIAIKLWLLLAGRTVAGSTEDELATTRVWNELWPPFETLALDVGRQGNFHTTLALLISSSVADLFTFLHSLHTPLSLQTEAHIAILDRLRNMSGMEAANRKISRAIAALSHSQPPQSQPFDLLVDQASKDIIATEKLRILESRNTGRGPPEKRPAERPRRNVRIPA
ncbi:hypothetical protein JOM56_003514 [Amanita muscaria]